jgi:para-aminobenzoate synthetase/4-amino-4-deoxychorismate lyase
MAVHPPVPGLPLLWFGLYPDAASTPPPNPGTWHAGSWTPGIRRAAYDDAIARIRALIGAGDTYQVNYTFPLRAPFDGDPWGWFQALRAAQGHGYFACIQLEAHAVVSVSPELFFALDGERITARPMKGTRRRGRWLDEDEETRAGLAASAKDRAENVMIVDLLRNDLGRIARSGTVHVPRLFDTERYETVWQMTSTVEAETDAPLPSLFGGLFPCGSVTGAPKIRTMEIIRDLETGPRGVYCGAVGWFGPGRRGAFNVPIRTVTVDTPARNATYHVGSGVTWDSAADAEYDECLDKAAVLRAQRPAFRLLETLLHDGEYFLLDRHLKRLADSAAYFGFDVDLEGVRGALAEYGVGLPDAPQRVRLLVSRDGAFDLEAAPTGPPRVFRIALAAGPVDSRDVFLHHKTTHREVYRRALAARPGFDDVVLFNERGEVTETTIGNVAVRMDDGWVTPPRACGLLPGTFRGHLLERGEVRERVVLVEELRAAREVAILNSVRKWVPCRIDFG